MDKEYEKYVQELGEAAHVASRRLATLSRKDKDALLENIAETLVLRSQEILVANQKDLELGDSHQLRSNMRDRLVLTQERIQNMAEGIRELVDLEDPIGKVLEEKIRPNGLRIEKVSVPLGVVLMMYEARPNVTVDAAALTLKTGNAVILRGGKEAFHTNMALVTIIQECLVAAGVPKEAVQLVMYTDRAVVTVLLQAKKYIDVVIPRGSAGLIERVVRESCIPVIETGSGVVHIFVDEFADLKKAVPIILNAKVQRPAVCNAVETVLIHEKVAEEILPSLQLAFVNAHVQVKGDERTMQVTAKLAETFPHLAPIFYDIEEAEESDFDMEYNDLKVSMKIVSSLEEVFDHIALHGTKHSESILTESKERAALFMQEVDASTVYVNASTRFTDGFEFGLGAEIGISTQKLHARGPMGLEALTSYKYLVYGNGQVRS